MPFSVPFSTCVPMPGPGILHEISIFVHRKQLESSTASAHCQPCILMRSEKTGGCTERCMASCWVYLHLNQLAFTRTTNSSLPSSERIAFGIGFTLALSLWLRYTFSWP